MQQLQFSGHLHVCSKLASSTPIVTTCFFLHLLLPPLFFLRHSQPSLVKQCTVLSDLTSDMWMSEHDALITNFIEDSSQQLLLVFNDAHSGLTISSDLPPFAVKELAYFIREEDVKVTVENFVTVLQFGTVHGASVDTLLRAMHGLYAPTFFENSTWPDSIPTAWLHNIYVYVWQRSSFCL